MNIEKPLRTIIVEPFEVPVDVPEIEPEAEPLKPETESVPANV